MGRLFWKIFLGFWLTLTIASAIVGGVVWQSSKDRIEHLELLASNPRANFGVNVVSKLLRSEGTKAVQELVKHRPVPVLIVNDNGYELFNRAIPDEMLQMARKQLKGPQQSAIQQVTTPKGENFLLFMPSRHMHPDLKQKRNFPQYLPLLPLTIFIIGSLLFSAGLAWYISYPIRHLRNATKRFASGHLNTRVIHKIGVHKDEMSDLAKDFDYMAEHIQQLIEAQKILLNDVSHELRSPLARLQLAADLTEQQPEKTKELLQRIKKESYRLDELIGDLLTLSRLESDINHNKTDHFDLSGLVDSIAKDARFEANSHNKKIVFHKTQEILFVGSIELLRRAIENVVRNAISYTQEITEVSITINKENERIIITICDNGPGIHESKLKQMFSPFVRINEKKQNIKTPGYGLGLAIARRSVEIHQGKISAYNRETGGLCVAISLPC